MRPTPWTFEWDEYAGYDCMWGAFVVRDATGRRITAIDAKTDREYAEGIARQIVEGVNAQPR